MKRTEKVWAVIRSSTRKPFLGFTGPTERELICLLQIHYSTEPVNGLLSANEWVPVEVTVTWEDGT